MPGGGGPEVAGAEGWVKLGTGGALAAVQRQLLRTIVGSEYLPMPGAVPHSGMADEEVCRYIGAGFGFAGALVGSTSMISITSSMRCLMCLTLG